MPVSCFGLWLAWKWAYELYGAKSALASAAIWAFNPDLIAHGSLVGTDLPTAVAMFAATYLWWRFCDEGGRRKLLPILAAIAFAAAQLSKFTAMILAPMLACVAIYRIIDRTITVRRAAIGLVTCAAISWLAVNLTYGFRGSFKPVREYPFESKSMKSLTKVWPGSVPLFMPYEYVAGFDVQKYESEVGVPAFLLGDSYLGSRWYTIRSRWRASCRLG